MRTSSASGDLSDSSSSALMAVRKAARVLPEPVGAAISVCRPAAIDSQPRSCADVGSPTSVVNHRRKRGWKPSKAMGPVDPEGRAPAIIPLLTGRELLHQVVEKRLALVERLDLQP